MLHGNQILRVMQQMHFHRIQHKKPVCFSFILHDSKSSQQDTQGKVQKAILITPAWKTQVWYPKILSMSIKSLILLPRRKYLLKNYKGDIHALVYNNTLQLARLQEMGISDSDFNFISKSRWPSLNANYEWNFRKWASWCPRKETDSFSSNANEILDNFILFI